MFQVARWLAADGVDFVHASPWGSAAMTRKRPDQHAVPLLRAAGPREVAVITRGGLWTAADAIELCGRGADMIALGRAAICNPEWPIAVRSRGASRASTTDPRRASRAISDARVPRGPDAVEEPRRVIAQCAITRRRGRMRSLTALRVAPRLSMTAGVAREIAESLSRIARPIRGEQDLDQLLDLIGAARVVLIGGASHGSHEFYDLRGALTRKLISKRGFAAVAIEADWPDALRVDRHVRWRGDDESAYDALGAFARSPGWMWRNTDVAAFIDWLRAWNSHRSAERRAGFYGLDLYSLHASVRAVLSLLDETDPAAVQRAREGYGSFVHGGGDPAHGMRAPFGLTDTCEAGVVAQLVEMQRRHAARSGRTPRGDSWFHAMQNARVIKDAEAYYRAMFGGRGGSWSMRDTHMADTLDLLAEQLGETGRAARLVVWAHNLHVGDARGTALGDRGARTLGQLMRQRHPGEVALIGMTTHTGSIRCARDWDQPALPEPLPPSLPGSWEELFHGGGGPRFYVTAASLRRIAGDRAERLHRAIGVVYRPETEPRGHYHRARLADQFDIVIHVDATHAVTLLKPATTGVTRAVTHDLPETSSGGG